MAKNSLARSPFEALLFLSGAVILLLLLRNSGLYPSVFADEYFYSKFARLIPLNEATVPDYVYLKLYSVTNSCGDGFLECAKIINSVLFVTAAPFIFLIARAVTHSALAVAVSLAAIIGPINSYTAYFMPESFYFLSFWVFAWYLLKIEPKSGKYCWLTAGAIYGFSALVKPHSLFFLPAILFYVFFFAFKHQKSDFIRQGLHNSACLIIGAFLMKLLVGYVLAGSSGVTIFGPAYGSIATSTSADPGRYLRLLTLSIESVKGHLLVLSLVYGLPLVLTILVSLQQLAPATISDYLGKISVFALVVILNLVFVVALFTASVTGSGPYESAARLHMRYYNFALPLFYIVAAGFLASDNFSVSKVSRYAVSGLVGGLALFALYTNMNPYLSNYVDNPEFRGLYINQSLFKIVGVLLILALFTWMAVGRSGLHIYLYVALPIAVLVSSCYITLELRARLVPDVYDKAGIFTKQYLSPDEVSKVLIVGSETGPLIRSLYHLDNPNAAFEVIPRSSVYDVSKLPAGKDWILEIGDQTLPETTHFKLSMNGFTLARIGPNNIDFRKASWPGLISRVQGLSHPEPWGTWSSSDLINFDFFRPLPEKFEVTLLASSFGPNAGKEFVADVGGSQSRFVLTGHGTEKVIFGLDNPNHSKTLSIRIPNPTSPKSLGINEDDRNLGIGLVELTIVSR